MYTFISRDANSSVYKALEKYLLTNRKGQWRKLNSESLRFNLMFGDRNKLPYTRLGQIQGLHQLVNYYRGSEVICRKCQMVRELKKYCLDNHLPVFPWLPTSFVIVPKCTDQANVEREQSILKEAISKCQKPIRQQQLDEREAILNLSDSNGVWIAKSSVGSKGDDIKISSSVKVLLEHVDKQAQAYIIQQYINNPFLLSHGRKFDIRCWVLLDSKCEIYLFKEGVLRTASETYKSSNLTDITSHLTNHSLQKQHSTKFGLYEKGNEMFYDEFNKYLVSCGRESLEVSILPQIKNIITTCLAVIKDSVSTVDLSYSSFQLFGFDFLLDDNMKVWLLEINGAPACAQHLLPSLVESLVISAIDHVLPAVITSSSTSLFEKLDNLP